MTVRRLGLILSILLAGVASSFAAVRADEIVLRRGNGAEPETLDPARVETVFAAWVTDDIFETLTLLDANDRPIPGAAESWQMSADGLTYTFKLRSDLLWSDGSKLTAQDFVYSLRRAIDPLTASPYAYLLFPIRNAREITEGKVKDLAKLGVDALDDRTLRFTLFRPTPYFLAIVSHGTLAPVQQANVEKWGASFTQPGHLVSNGAYVLQEWTPNSRIVVVRNPHYHDAVKVHVDKVIYYPIESPTEELNRYRAGELDLTYLVPYNQLDSLRQTYGPELAQVPEFVLEWWGFNLTKPPFANNPKLRQAMAMVIDRELIRDKVLHTGYPIAYGVVPPGGDPNYASQQVSWAALPMADRTAKAKELYREAGYGPDHPLTVEVRMQSDENSRKTIIAMAAMWQSTLGIKVEPIPEEFKTLLDDRHQKAVTQLFENRWGGDYPDATTFLDLFLAESGENDDGYKNPDFDALIATAEQTVDTAQRAALLEKAERLVLEDNAVITMYDRTRWRLVKPYVKGYIENPCSNVYSKDVTILPHS